MDEEQTNMEMLVDKNRKTTGQLEQLAAELGTERANSQKLENARSQLERQNKELRAKLAESEQQVRGRKVVNESGDGQEYKEVRA